MMVLSSITEYIGLHWLIINSVFCIIIYNCLIRNWSYFSKQNVKFVRGLPIIGAQYRAIFGKESFFEGSQRMYDEGGDEKFYGIFDMGGTPKYIIRDPELIKQISIKDFDHFTNHLFKMDSDPVFGRSLFMMRDQRWRDMRATLSPAFTGSKMRLMFVHVVEVSQTFCDTVKSLNKITECDLKDLVTRFANDAIASCAFGVKINSLADRANEFYSSGNALSNIGAIATIKFFAYAAIPKVMNFFKVQVFNAKEVDYFKKIVRENMAYRERNNIVRDDMINILLETKKGTLKPAHDNDNQDPDDAFSKFEKRAREQQQSIGIPKWTEDDLIAQTMLFFLAGYSTVSMTLAFAAHELTVNPHIQEKLYNEIMEVEKSLQGKPLTYELLHKMKYMDMVLNETMRIWPQSPANDRIVTKPYTLKGSMGNKVQLNVDDGLWLTALGIHMDPKYFPNPKKFDPERFSDENKDKLVPGTFMPFGLGPRICIASRFATMECKCFIYHLILNFHLEKSSKTQDPIKLKCGSGTIEGENGFWMKLIPRK